MILEQVYKFIHFKTLFYIYLYTFEVTMIWKESRRRRAGKSHPAEPRKLNFESEVAVEPIINVH